VEEYAVRSAHDSNIQTSRYAEVVLSVVRLRYSERLQQDCQPVREIVQSSLQRHGGIGSRWQSSR